METITLQQLQTLFSDLRAETTWDVDGEMLWGYFFLSPDPDKLMAAGGALAERGYEIVGVFENDEEEGDEDMHVLQVERVEAHTPESLHARNQELEAFAAEYGLDSYDGMDVNPVDSGDDDSVEEDGGGAIENPELVAAMEALQEDDSAEAQEALTAQLFDAVFLLPVSGEPSEEEDDESLQLIVCTDDDGVEFLPLFTDVGALKNWAEETTSAIAIDSSEAWEYVLNLENCAGAVINPGDASLAIPRDQVEILSNAMKGDGNEEE